MLSLRCASKCQRLTEFGRIKKKARLKTSGPECNQFCSCSKSRNPLRDLRVNCETLLMQKVNIYKYMYVCRSAQWMCHWTFKFCLRRDGLLRWKIQQHLQASGTSQTLRMLYLKEHRAQSNNFQFKINSSRVRASCFVRWANTKYSNDLRPLWHPRLHLLRKTRQGNLHIFKKRLQIGQKLIWWSPISQLWPVFNFKRLILKVCVGSAGTRFVFSSNRLRVSEFDNEQKTEMFLQSDTKKTLG